MEKKTGGVWKCFLPGIVILSLQMVISYFAMFFAFCFQAYNYTQGSFSEFVGAYYDTVMSAEFNVWVMLIYASVAIVWFAVWYRGRVLDKNRTKKARQMIRRSPWRFVTGTILMTVGMQYLCTYLMSVLSVWFPQWLEEYESLMDGMGVSEGLTIPLLLYMVILGPVCEELAFRGLTMGYARRSMNFWAANIIQALLFAGMHMNPMQAVYTFLFGLVLGYFVEKSGSLWIGIMLHICFNGFGMFSDLLSFGGNGPVQFFLWIFGSLAASYVGIVLLNKNMEEESKQEVQ